LSRNASLDLLRAGAIAMVVAYHVNQMSPGAVAWTLGVTRFGALGVDLFFVLSGWLVGGLYWAELARRGTVNGFRFVLSRAARTMPPYFAVLPVAWLGARVARGEPFDFGYLVFAQNYYDQIPFYFVSWSLCVEEHFYLALPLLLLLVRRSRATLHSTFLVGSLAPSVTRALIESGAAQVDFGFLTTATHLRCEGLLLGVWLSYVAVHEQGLYRRLVRASRWAALPLMLLIGLVALGGSELEYVVGGLVVAVAFSALLLAIVDMRPWPSARVIRAVYWASISSYSCYLVHSMAIHAARTLASRAGAAERPAYFVVAIAAIAIATAGLHVAIERPVLRWRSRRFPSSYLFVGPVPALQFDVGTTSGSA